MTSNAEGSRSRDRSSPRRATEGVLRVIRKSYHTLTRGHGVPPARARAWICGLTLGHLAARFCDRRGAFAPFKEVVHSPHPGYWESAFEELQARLDPLVSHFDSRWADGLDEPGVAPLLEQTLAALTESSLAEPSLLTSVFEVLHDQDTRSRGGVFYTPLALAQGMVSLLAPRGVTDLPCTVLDPACGGGVFLLAALRLGDARQRESLCARLFGVDRDPEAVAVSRAVLRAELFSAGDHLFDPRRTLPSLQENIRCGNSLLGPEDIPAEPLTVEEHDALAPFDWRDSFPDVWAQGGGFEGIIANPPYGLSRDGRIAPGENAILKTRYQESRSGKANHYLLFLARMLELAAPKARLIFIVPNAWLGISAGRKMRDTLRVRKMFAAIHRFRRSPFSEPGVEPIVVVLDNHRPHTHVDLHSHDGTLLPTRPPSSRISLEVTAGLPDGLIPLTWNEETERITARMGRLGRILGGPDSPFLPLIALQVYARGKGVPPQTAEVVRTHPFHLAAPTEETIPYLQGRDITRFGLRWSGAHLRYGEWLAEYQPRERFDGPRIVVREILSEGRGAIIAAYTDQPFVYNRSVLHIIARSGVGSLDVQREMMWALLALLNSSPVTVWIRAVGRKSQRSLFPKLVNEDLRTLPLPPNFERAISDLAPLARAATEKGGLKFEDAIDRIVGELYGLAEVIPANRLAWRAAHR